ncbi:MAG: MSCRAMM family protein [Bacillota bacterium]
MLDKYMLGDKYVNLMTALPPGLQQLIGKNISGVPIQAAEREEGNSLVGEVKDRFTSQPQVGVVAHLYDQDGKLVLETTTNQEGMFTFQGLKPDRYQVKVEASGYISQIKSGPVREREARVVFNLEPKAPGAFRGTVRHWDHPQVLDGITVEVSDGHLTYNTETDAEGCFFLGPIFSGAYRISVRKGQYQKTTQSRYTVPPGSIISLKITLPDQVGTPADGQKFIIPPKVLAKERNGDAVETGRSTPEGAQI